MDEQDFERLVARVEELELAMASIRKKLRKADAVAPEPKQSAEELVEAFAVEEAHREWARKNAPTVPIDVEVEAWKDRCRTNDYRAGRNKIRDAQASFYTACRNAEAWGTYRKGGNLFAKHQPPRSVPDEISPQVAKLIGARK